MDNFKSYKDKISDFGIKEGDFKDETGKQVNFKQLVLRVVLDGDVEELVLSGANAPKPKLLQTILKGATSTTTPPSGSFLSDVQQ